MHDRKSDDIEDCEMNQDNPPDSELLPCPFCGGTAAHNRTRYHPDTAAENQWGQDVFFGVNCRDCGVNNRGAVGHKTPEDAAAAWNTRASAMGMIYAPA